MLFLKDVRMCYEIKVRATENQVVVFFAVYIYLVETGRG